MEDGMSGEEDNLIIENLPSNSYAEDFNIEKEELVYLNFNSHIGIDLL